MWNKRNLSTRWFEFKMAQPLWKKVWWFLRKLNVILSYSPALRLFSIYPKELKTSPTENHTQHKHLLINVCISFLHKCPNSVAAMVPFSRWIEKSIVIRSNNEVLFSVKEKLAIKSWEDMVNAWYQVKGDHLKRLPTVWFQV